MSAKTPQIPSNISLFPTEAHGTRCHRIAGVAGLKGSLVIGMRAILDEQGTPDQWPDVELAPSVMPEITDLGGNQFEVRLRISVAPIAPIAQAAPLQAVRQEASTRQPEPVGSGTS